MHSASIFGGLPICPTVTAIPIRGSCSLRRPRSQRQEHAGSDRTRGRVRGPPGTRDHGSRRRRSHRAAPCAIEEGLGEEEGGPSACRGRMTHETRRLNFAIAEPDSEERSSIGWSSPREFMRPHRLYTWMTRVPRDKSYSDRGACPMQKLKNHDLQLSKLTDMRHEASAVIITNDPCPSCSMDDRSVFSQDFFLHTGTGSDHVRGRRGAASAPEQPAGHGRGSLAPQRA